MCTHYCTLNRLLQVRLEAIESLTAIARHIKLHVHQLEIVLGGLDDYSTLLREKLHLMIQVM